LAVGVVEVGFTFWAVEEGGDEFAGNLGVGGDGDVHGIDDWVLERSDFADQIRGEMLGDGVNLKIIST
jgi:hypothetical protein